MNKMSKKLTVALIIICVCVLSYVGKRIYTVWSDNQKITFMTRWLPVKAAECELQYSYHFELDWLKNFAITMTESRGKKNAKSSAGALGFKQVMQRNLNSCRDYFKGTITPRGY